MIENTKFVESNLLNLIKLSVIDIELTVVEVSSLDWLSYKFEFSKLIFILFKRSIFSISINPFNTFVDFFNKGSFNIVLNIFFPWSI